MAFKPQLLDGVNVIQIPATKTAVDDQAPLYSELNAAQTEATQVTLVPYYAWANREDGQMTVWQNYDKQ